MAYDGIAVDSQGYHARAHSSNVFFRLDWVAIDYLQMSNTGDGTEEVVRGKCD